MANSAPTLLSYAMQNSHAEVVICGAGIAGIAAAHELAVVHGVRNIVAGSGASGSLQDQVAGYRQEIKRLEDQLTHMVAAHAGLIRAVQMAGGGPALERFWRAYKAVGDAVHSHSAANVERPVANLPLRVVKMSDETAA